MIDTTYERSKQLRNSLSDVMTKWIADNRPSALELVTTVAHTLAGMAALGGYRLHEVTDLLRYSYNAYRTHRHPA